MISDLITVSRMRDFNACRRRHHIKYELGYRPISTAAALSFGTLVHAGLEEWWRSRGDLPTALAAVRCSVTDDVDPVALAKVEVLLAGYHARWLPTMADFEVLDVEKEFRAPLRNPATGYPCRDLEVAGKLDVIVRKRADGSVWFVEHKTSAEDLSSGSTYWQRLRMDPQVSVYYDGAKALGHDIAGCIYDVLAKPRERLLLATPEAARKYKKDGTLYASQRDRDETIDEFRDRVMANMVESPESYFGRAEVVRTEAELVESAKDTHATALMIRECERTGRNPRNPDACFLPGRSCAFHDVCCGVCGLDDDTRFIRLASVHPELGNDNN